MKLLFKGETIQLNNELSLEFVKEKINSLLADQYFFSHLVVDGVEIYEEPEQYLEQHLHDINELEIIARTVQEFVNDLLLTAEDYTKRAIPEIEALADHFYNHPNHEGWNKFGQLLEGLQWLTHMIQTIDSFSQKPENWMNYLKASIAVEEELKNLKEALENKDHVLIADIINYEILPYFTTLGAEIQHTIDTEGYRHDLN